jgi:hypothetical protein
MEAHLARWTLRNRSLTNGGPPKREKLFIRASGQYSRCGSKRADEGWRDKGDVPVFAGPAATVAGSVSLRLYAPLL